MPRKRVIRDDEKDSSSNKKLGRPSGNTKGMEDTHPRLQSGFFRTQVMVYDTSHEPARNEIEYMLSNYCQRCIDDGDNTWAFMLRQLVNVFITMAFDKLKTRAEDLTITAQCEAMVPEFEGAILTLHLREDPVNATVSWAQWLKQYHTKCSN